MDNTERLALLMSGCMVSNEAPTQRFVAQDFVFEESPSLEIRSLPGGYDHADSRNAGPTAYLRFWTNASASIGTDISPGCYEVGFLGLDDSPGPVLLRVYANDLPLGNLWYCRDDNLWSTESLIVTPSYWLATGAADDRLTVRFSFANDGPDARGERDAGIALVTISSRDCLLPDGSPVSASEQAPSGGARKS